MLVDLVQTTTRDGVRLDGMLQMPTAAGFRGAPEALADLAPRAPRLTAITVRGADHFYTNARAALVAHLDQWLCGVGN